MLWLGVILAVLGLILIIIMVRLARNSGGTAGDEAGADAAGGKRPQSARKRRMLSDLGPLNIFSLFEGRDAGVVEMAKAFVAALRYLQRRLGGGEEAKYRLPWVLMLGANSAGKTTALHASGMTLPFGRPLATRALASKDCRWWVFERGIVLDLSGGFLSGSIADGDDIAAEKKWRWFLTLLDKFRARRPIDGVIVTIPADELTGAAALSLEAIAARANRINARLVMAQKLLGFAFPIYVVVTKADYLRGFSGFWRQVPATHHNGMFGWSSPFAPNVTFQPEWVSTAFDSLSESLFQIQLELAIIADTVGDENDNMFLFPQSVAALREPLGAYLKTLFRSSGTFDPLMLRGIYFVGDFGSVSPETSLVPVAETGAEETLANRRRIILLQDILEKKIFLETGLAIPLPSSLALQNRNLALARASFFLVTAVLTGGVALGARDVSADVNQLQPSIRTMAQMVKQIQARKQNQQSNVSASELGVKTFREQDVVDLFAVMTKVRGNKIGNLFLPGSWISSINTDLSSFIRIGFDSVILSAMHSQMQVRVELAVAGRSSQDGRSSQKPKPPAGQISIPEYLRLANLIGDLKQIEFLYVLYNNLGETRDLGDLGTLVSELFGITLPQNFYEHSDLFRDALVGLDYRKFDPTPFRGQTTARLRSLAQELFARLFESGPLLQELTALTEILQRVGGESGAIEADDAAFAKTLEHLQQAEALLAGPDAAWISSSDPTKVGDFAIILASIGQSAFFTRELSQEIVEILNKSFERYQSQISKFQAAPFGLILARDQMQHMQPALSTALTTFQKSLESLFAQSFMVATAPGIIADRRDPNSMISWDARLLTQAITTFTDFDLFTSERLSGFPASLRERIRTLAANRMANNMTAAVAKAQSFKVVDVSGWRLLGEAELAQNVSKFRAAAPHLDRLLTIFRQNQMQSAYAALRAISGSQASALLLAVDAQLEGESLYLPLQPFDQWDGQDPATMFGYNSFDDHETQAYLKQQRERIAFLVREYTEPVLSFLLRRDLMQDTNIQPTISRWQRIAEEVGRYSAHRPDSAIMALERFIRFDMGGLRAGTCADRLKRLASPERSGDFFRQRLDWLRGELLNRCNIMIVNEARRVYGDIANRFNSTLAGRFPFANGDVPAEATVPQVVNFLREATTTGSAIRPQLMALQGLNPGVRSALQFLDQLAAVKDMLDLIVPPGEGAPEDQAAAANVAIQVDFRVNRSVEKNANNVIGWAIESGERVVRHNDEKRKLVWRSGDPLRVQMRWAKDAPYQPLGRPEGEQFAVMGQSVTFNYQGAWALLRLIALHSTATSDPEPEGGGSSATLRFEVPTVDAMTVLSPTATASIVTAKAFIRLRFPAAVVKKDSKEGAEGKEPKDLRPRGPALRFPTSAPKF